MQLGKAYLKNKIIINLFRDLANCWVPSTQTCVVTAIITVSQTEVFAQSQTDGIFINLDFVPALPFLELREFFS